MSRNKLATLATIVFVLGWIVGAVALADWLPPLHWAVQAVFWLVVGFVWVFPIWGLMLWAARGRKGSG
jgi:hypothetical protein